MTEVRITDNLASERLDKAIRKILRNAPDSFIFKMLRKKNITLNGRKAAQGDIVACGDVLQFWLSDETFTKMSGGEPKVTRLPDSFPDLRVIYADSDVLIFEKPQGILSQKASESDVSANEWVVSYALKKGILTEEALHTFRPSVCNRLDRNTGGILCAGLSLKGLQVLSTLFRDRTLGKYYLALVLGETKTTDSLHGYLLKDEKSNKVTVLAEKTDRAERIDTEYERLYYEPERNLSLIRVHLITGKSHQIRAHLSATGHPILGDPKYGDLSANKLFGRHEQCLWAYEVAFPPCALPGISDKTFRYPPPDSWPLLKEGGIL